MRARAKDRFILFRRQSLHGCCGAEGSQSTTRSPAGGTPSGPEHAEQRRPVEASGASDPSWPCPQCPARPFWPQRGEPKPRGNQTPLTPTVHWGGRPAGRGTARRPPRRGQTQRYPGRGPGMPGMAGARGAPLRPGDAPSPSSRAPGARPGTTRPSWTYLSSVAGRAQAAGSGEQLEEPARSIGRAHLPGLRAALSGSRPGPSQLPPGSQPDPAPRRPRRTAHRPRGPSPEQPPDPDARRPDGRGLRAWEQHLMRALRGHQPERLLGRAALAQLDLDLHGQRLRRVVALER